MKNSPALYEDRTKGPDATYLQAYKLRKLRHRKLTDLAVSLGQVPKEAHVS